MWAIVEGPEAQLIWTGNPRRAPPADEPQTDDWQSTRRTLDWLARQVTDFETARWTLQTATDDPDVHVVTDLDRHTDPAFPSTIVAVRRTGTNLLFAVLQGTNPVCINLFLATEPSAVLPDWSRDYQSFQAQARTLLKAVVSHCISRAIPLPEHAHTEGSLGGHLLPVTTGCEREDKRTLGVWCHPA